MTQTAVRTWRSYENGLLVLLSAGSAVAALDGQALFYLSPFVAKDLGLNNAQVGLLASVVLITWSVAGYLLGAWSDRTGRRKPYLVGAFVLFGVSSGLSGLAGSFAALFAARLLIGCAEGPVIPLSASLMMEASSPQRRGFNLGVVQNFGAQIVGSMLAPVLLVKLATEFSWHAAFYLAGIPGLLMAVLLALFVREPAKLAGARAVRPPFWQQLQALLGSHNIRLCALISIGMVCWYWMLLTFLPLYCVRVLNLTPARMSYVMGASGAAAVIGALLLPALSDRIGRRPVLAVSAFVAIVAPLAPLWIDASFPGLVTAVFIGSLAVGAIPLFMCTVPLESVPASAAAGASGLIMGVGQVIGGFGGPSIGGLLADRFSLAVPLCIAATAVAIAGVLALSLHETAPRKLVNVTPAHPTST